MAFKVNVVLIHLFLVFGCIFGKPTDVTTERSNDVTTVKPDESTKVPSVTTESPELTTKGPEEGTTKMPDESEKPEGTTEAPEDGAKTPDNGGSKPSQVVSLGVDTGEKIDRWSEAAKDAVRKPSDIIKESVNIVKDGVKLSSELGEAAVNKGIVHLGKQGVATVSDLGKMGINVTATIANSTLGLIHKIGDMMPVGGRLVKGGVSLGRKGLEVAKALGENFFDNLVWLADSGLGWLQTATSSSKNYVLNRTESLASAANEGIDNGAGRVGQMLSAGIGKLPYFRVNASLHVG